ncbi:MAG TPA: hypothetical protein VGC67_17555 [Cellulomonas sp.]
MTTSTDSSRARGRTAAPGAAHAGGPRSTGRRRLLVTSHCILNQNAVVQPLARSSGVLRSAAEWALDQGYEIFQLPCPEFRFAGPHRAGASFDDYNTAEFHASNRELLGPVVERLRRYQDAGYEIVGGLHVQGSPACDPDTGNWITDLLAAAHEAGIEIDQLWQVPATPDGAFDPADPATSFGDPSTRAVYPADATTVSAQDRARLVCGATIPVRPAAPVPVALRVVPAAPAEPAPPARPVTQARPATAAR